MIWSGDLNLNLNFKNLRIGILASIVFSSLKSCISCNNMNHITLKSLSAKIAFVTIDIIPAQPHNAHSAFPKFADVWPHLASDGKSPAHFFRGPQKVFPRCNEQDTLWTWYAGDVISRLPCSCMCCYLTVSILYWICVCKSRAFCILQSPPLGFQG